MKIRTFVTCENLVVDKEKNTTTITSMIAGFRVPELPIKKDVILVFTFDEVEAKEKKLEIALLNHKDKALTEWKRDMKTDQNSISMKLNMEFFEEGNHNIKISYDDGQFLGKYPFFIRKEVK